MAAAFTICCITSFRTSGDFSEINGLLAFSDNIAPIGVFSPINISLFDTSCSNIGIILSRKPFHTTTNIYPIRFIYSLMKKLSLTDTQELINSYVKSFGQSGAAKQLSEKGYRSPTGGQILQAHVFRIINGSGTCLLAPETEDQQQQKPTTKEPIAAVPKIQKRIAEELFADEELLQQEINKTSEELRQELEDERLALEELERSMPPLVPCTGDHPHRERRHLERDIKVSAIFNRRGAVELDEEGATYFNIPKLKHKPPAIVSRPYQPRQYGRNVLSTRDLTVREK